MKVLVPFGTRPEMVKLSSVLAAIRQRGMQVHTVATGQHFDPGLSDVFLDELGIEPDERWTLPDAEADRVGTILSSAYRCLVEQRPDVVLVLGDTHTVPMFCLAARRHGIPSVHLEAGLRSFNETSLEEVNRRVAAATASLHLAPTLLAEANLLSEGVAPERVRVVGNSVLDVLRQRNARALPADLRHGVVFTAHRASNVDSPERLEALVRLVRRLADEVGPVCFPMHPRTLARLIHTGLVDQLDHEHVRLGPPLPYDEMLNALAGARVIVTDSGGLQEEAAWLGIPVVVLRTSTPRWEGVRAGHARLVGLDVDLAVAAAIEFSLPESQARVAGLDCPYGDGHTGERVADILADPTTLDLLRLREPALGSVGPFA